MDLDKFEIDDKAKGEIQAAIDAEIEGLKNKNTELLGKQKQYKTDFESVQAKLAEFDGMDIAGLKKLAESAKDSKEAEMLKAGQFNELLQMKIKESLDPVSKEAQKAKERAKELETELSTSRQNNRRMMIENTVRNEASNVGDLHSSAVDDIVLRALNSWSVEDGKLVNVDDKEMKLADWIEGMREKHPHYFGKASGTGSRGGNSTTTTTTGDMGGDIKQRQAAIKARFNLEQ